MTEKRLPTSQKTLSTPGIIPNVEDGLNSYLRTIRQFPMLDEKEEFMLAKRWHEKRDPKAAEDLIKPHLRLVAKIANGYKGYGLPIGDLISEGNVGLMQAVTKFDPDKGFRLSTYAMWWIKAYIQEYVLKSWSLVKIGTTASQKKLFFNLRRLKQEIQEADETVLTAEQIKDIATELNVSEKDVESMSQRMGQDVSLNSTTSGGEDNREWQDWLADDRSNQETHVVEASESKQRNQYLEHALKSLSQREHHIITHRRLLEKPKTLEEMSQELGVSRERVRQIENRAFQKLQKAVKNRALEHHQEMGRERLSHHS